jgi:WD40 repeat protein
MMTAAISRDGNTIATGSGHPNQAGELVVWEADTGRQRWQRPFPRGIRSVAFTSDGRQIVAGSFDGVARVHDAASGDMLKEFRGHTDAINAVALSSDDRWLATGSHDQTVIMWNLADGSRRHTLRGHLGDVLTVAISAGGKLLASGGRENVVRIWNLQSGDVLHTLAGHEQLVEMVAFSPDDAHLATASWDGTLRIWDVATGMPQGILRRGTRISSVAFAPRGKEVWSGGFDGQLAAWLPDADTPPRTFKAQDGAVYAVALSADGSRIVTCGFEGTARLWQADGTLIHKLDRQPALAEDARSIVRAAWSGSGELLATVHGDGVLRLTRAASGQAAGELKLADARIVDAVFATDGQRLAVATHDGNVIRWDVAAKSDAQATFARHAGGVAALALAPDGMSLVSVGREGSIEIHRLAVGKPIASAFADSPVRCVAVVGRGHMITGHDDGRLRAWSIADAKELASEIRLSSPARAIAVSPDGRTLALELGSSIELWQLALDGNSSKASGRRVFTLPEGEVTQVQFSAGGEQIISGDTTGQVRLWTLSGGGARTLARKHAGGVTALALAPGDQTLFTAGADLTAWVWHPERSEGAIRPLASIPAHEKGTRYVALARDGRLVSDGYDNHIRVWNLATGQEERDLGVPDSASACVLLASGTHVAVGHWSKRIQLVELATGRRLDNIRGLPRGPYAIDVSPDERYMAAAFRELGAAIYNLKADEADAMVTLPPDELPFTHVAFSPEGKTFVTCTGDYQRMELAGKVRLHEVKTGKVIREFVGHSSEVKMAAFDRAGNRLATCGGDKTVRIWDVSTGRMLALFPHPIGTFTPLFVEGTDLVIAADYHGKVYFWDLTKTAPVQVVSGHADLINRLALSEDRSVLATGSRDGTVRLWKLAGEGNALRIVSADEARSP